MANSSETECAEVEGRRTGCVGFGIFSDLQQNVQFYREEHDACCPREFWSPCR